MKRDNLIKAVFGLLTTSALCLTGCSGGIFTFFVYNYDNADKYTAGDREITDKITTINIDYVSGDVKFRGTDSDKVTIKETANTTLSEEHKVHTWVDGSTLYVRFCASTKKISFFKIEKDLEITVPGSQTLENLTVKVSSGNMDFSGFKTDKLIARSSSGDVGFSCTASEAEVKASSGKIDFTQEGDGKSIDISSSSGGVAVRQKGSIDSVKINSSSGSIDALLDKAASVDVHASSGNISIEAEEIADLKSSASSGHNEFRFDKVPKTSDIHSSSGYVKIYVPEDSDLTVHPHISSGELNYDLPLSKKGKDYINGSGANEMTIRVSSGDVNINKI